MYLKEVAETSFRYVTAGSKKPSVLFLTPDKSSLDLCFDVFPYQRKGRPIAEGEQEFYFLNLMCANLRG